MVLLYNVQIVTTTTEVSNQNDTILINAVDEIVNVILPQIMSNGQRYLIKRNDETTNSVYIIPMTNTLDTVNGTSSQTIYNSQVIEVVSIGSNWEFFVYDTL
jgi:hypothetical protein